jgi:hypothetical protein
MEGGAEKGQPAAASDPKVEALKFRALFPYTSQNEDELSFQVVFTPHSAYQYVNTATLQ